ncbi:MAG: hypothetical protein V4613_00520 [Bacteroidota bacterium]
MKKVVYSFGLLMACIVLMGCPYESTVTIDEPSVNVPSGLISTWEIETSNENANKFVIKKEGDFVMRINKKASETSYDEGGKYKAFISKIGEVDFLQVYEVNEDWTEKKEKNDKGKEVAVKEYYIYRMLHNDDYTKVTLQPLSENISEKFATSAELKAFLEKYKDLSFLCDKKEDVYIKIED